MKWVLIPSIKVLPSYLLRRRLGSMPLWPNHLLSVLSLNTIALGPCIMTHAFNSSIWITDEERDLWVWGQPGLHREFQDSRGYIVILCLKKYCCLWIRFHYIILGAHSHSGQSTILCRCEVAFVKKAKIEKCWWEYQRESKSYTMLVLYVRLCTFKSIMEISQKPKNKTIWSHYTFPGCTPIKIKGWG